MSRSRSRSRSHSRPREEKMELEMDRLPSEDRVRERPDQEEVPVKRARVDTTREDRARGKRMFGNILGTLQRFKKDDKNLRTSDAAKKREELSERIATKLKSETSLHTEILEREKELKGLRISTDSSDFVIKHKEATMIARHASLKPTSRFLYTSLPSNAPFIHEGNLLNPAPIPLATGPRREPPHPKAAQPLYFVYHLSAYSNRKAANEQLPKILLPHQKSTLDSRIANIDELITDEREALGKEKELIKRTSRSNKARIEELADSLDELRRKVKPDSARASRGDRERDDFGRTPKEKMEVDEREDSVMREREEREKGVQIKGEDGNVEVEY